MSDDQVAAAYGAMRKYVWWAVSAGQIARDDAEDVVQTAMLRAWRGAPTWEPGKASIGTWGVAIARRVASDFRADNARREALKRELAGSRVDLLSVRPCGRIAADRDAMYAWDEQVGRWMADNTPVFQADLDRLERHIMKNYLSKKTEE